ncbi:MAG: hypothetical protein ACRDF7_05970 [Candidatus Limnocylindrales bacterium]
MLGRADLELRLDLLRAGWAYFDDVAARVSPELRPNPRGGERSRDQIVRHVLANVLDPAWEMEDRDPGDTPAP